METAEHTEKFIGRCTVETVSTNGKGERSTSQASRPLLMADELLRRGDRHRISFIRNFWPVILKRHRTSSNRL